MTSRYLRRFRKEPGLPPGTVAYHGPERDHEVTAYRVQYSPDMVSEGEVAIPAVTLEGAPDGFVTWFDFDGVHDSGMVADVAMRFGLDPLGVEDIVSMGQRPKAVDTAGALYVTLRAVTVPPGSSQIRGEQISLILQPRSILSFQEQPGDLFEVVRERVRAGKGKIRSAGSDYLLYALLDVVVDGYYDVIADLAARIEVIEDLELDQNGSELTGELQALRKEVLIGRRAMWPLKEALERIMKSEGGLIDPDTVPFFADVQDHLTQLIEAADLMKESLASIADSYASIIGLRSNEVMQMLTLIATIFIPLTFLAGIYGMNFEIMPELGWPWAYPALMSVMAAIGVGMVVYFKRKGWL